jgi:dienelactone hydrolase
VNRTRCAARLLALLLGLAGSQTLRADLPLQPIMMVDPVYFTLPDSEPAIAVRVLFPRAAQATLPVIIFSHGAYLSRDHYAQLTHYWARKGFLVLQPDHPGAAVDGFRGNPVVQDDLWRRRIRELAFLKAKLSELETAVPTLRGRIDYGRVYLAGHSFGAHSVAALMGARVWNAPQNSFEDFSVAGVRGALLLSPPGMGDDALKGDWVERGSYLRVDWSQLRGPLFVAVGAQDAVATIMTTRDASWHSDIYQRTDLRPMCLLRLGGVGHYLGGIVDPRRSGAEDSRPESLALLRAATLLFLANPDANLEADLQQDLDRNIGDTVQCRS